MRPETWDGPHTVAHAMYDRAAVFVCFSDLRDYAEEWCRSSHSKLMLLGQYHWWSVMAFLCSSFFRPPQCVLVILYHFFLLRIRPVLCYCEVVCLKLRLQTLTGQQDKHLLYYNYKCTKHQFIHLSMATCNDWHIENSKNHKKVISLTITLSNCQCAVE